MLMILNQSASWPNKPEGGTSREMSTKVTIKITLEYVRMSTNLSEPYPKDCPASHLPTVSHTLKIMMKIRAVQDPLRAPSLIPSINLSPV